MKTKQFRITPSRVYGFHVVEMRNDLGWEAISKPMDLAAANSALEQLNNRNNEPAQIVVENDVPQQGIIPCANPPSQVLC